MGLLDAGSSGWCLRWSATASMTVHRQVGDERHGRCALVSARGPGDGGEVLTGSWFPEAVRTSAAAVGFLLNAGVKAAR